MRLLESYSTASTFPRLARPVQEGVLDTQAPCTSLGPRERLHCCQCRPAPIYSAYQATWWISSALVSLPTEPTRSSSSCSHGSVGVSVAAHAQSTLTNTSRQADTQCRAALPQRHFIPPLTCFLVYGGQRSSRRRRATSGTSSTGATLRPSSRTATGWAASSLSCWTGRTRCWRRAPTRGCGSPHAACRTYRKAHTPAY